MSTIIHILIVAVISVIVVTQTKKIVYLHVDSEIQPWIQPPGLSSYISGKAGDSAALFAILAFALGLLVAKL